MRENVASGTFDMKKVCIFNFPDMDDFHGYSLKSFNPLAYFERSAHWGLGDLFRFGVHGWNHRYALLDATGVDRLYRERNSAYMRMIKDFVDEFSDYDLIVMSTYNFIHPEIWWKYLQKPIKILGFIDDPYSTLRRDLPCLWAFDGAFYISPSYIDDILFQDAFHRWRKPARWFPLVFSQFEKPEKENEAFFTNRTIDACYVGNPHPGKVNRLVKMKKHFGQRIAIHGRWKFWGYAGFLQFLYGQKVYPHRVKSLTDRQRQQIYWSTKIGFNMHVSDAYFETGNARMYEIPAHGMMMVCDKGGAKAHSSIFEDGREAVFYDSLDEAIEIIDYYAAHEKERLDIAQRGYERFWKDYEWEKNLKEFLDWAINLPQNG